MTNLPPPPGSFGSPSNHPRSDTPPSPPQSWNAAPTASTGPSSGARMLGWLMVAAAAVVAIAAFLVWAKFSFNGRTFEIKGIGGETAGADVGAKDGVLTLILAIVVAAFGAVRGSGRLALNMAIGATVAGAFIVIIAFIDIADLGTTEDELGITVDAGIGLWLTLVGGITIVVTGIAGIIKRH